MHIIIMMAKAANLCMYGDCATHANFGSPGEKAQYCKAHASVGMINVNSKKCQQEDCNKQPVFNKPGASTAIYCKDHASVDMVDVKSKKCQHADCNKQPTFNRPGEPKPIYCKAHASIDMVDVVHKRCQRDGCNKHPSFNKPGEQKPIYCKAHASIDMVYVVHKRCQQDGCDRIPSFNKPGEIKPIYCKSHAPIDMVDVKSKKCQRDGCDKRPSFNKPGELTPIYCKAHASIEMVDINSKKCQHSGCNRIPSFNKPGEQKTIYCRAHASIDMVNVRSQKCQHAGCDRQPAFNKSGEQKRIYCKAHAFIDMVDIKNKKCQHTGCKTNASYALQGHPLSYCGKHKNSIPNLFFRPNKKCDSCNEPPVFGLDKPERCEAHKTPTDINLAERKCSQCGLLMVLDKEGYCEYCHPKTVKTVRLAKQNAIMEYLDVVGLEGTSTDKIVDISCGKERPDRVFDCGHFVVILEVDEGQHKDRNCVCEQTRMINIFNMFGGVQVLFIRFNPDVYKTDHGIENPRRRHVLCADLIEELISEKYERPEALCAAIYLYFDGWTKLADESWQKLV